MFRNCISEVIDCPSVQLQEKILEAVSSHGPSYEPITKTQPSLMIPSKSTNFREVQRHSVFSIIVNSIAYLDWWRLLERGSLKLEESVNFPVVVGAPSDGKSSWQQTLSAVIGDDNRRLFRCFNKNSFTIILSSGLPLLGLVCFSLFVYFCYFLCFFNNMRLKNKKRERVTWLDRKLLLVTKLKCII